MVCSRKQGGTVLGLSVSFFRLNTHSRTVRERMKTHKGVCLLKGEAVGKRGKKGDHKRERETGFVCVCVFRGDLKRDCERVWELWQS